jgi:pimeloyl-ACP methyl ester carboxylesterase
VAVTDPFSELMREGARVGRMPLRPLAVQESRLGADAVLLEVITAEGVIVCAGHKLAEADEVTTFFLGGALGGLSGPAHGLYDRLAKETGGVRIHYRRPGHVDDCVMDVLLVHHILSRRGLQRVVLVGHSFGGAIAIGAGALLGPATAGVVALSTQVPGTEHVEKLAGRPLLLVHGEADGILPDLCSRNVYERAEEPKELVLLAGEGHLLDGAADQLTALVGGFVAKATADG